ncbi:MAG: HigA family addiction module antitoxin [Gammaproteobacteria bacterium]
MTMQNPAHPGEILRELVMNPLQLSVTEVSEHLGVSRKTLSKILNGRGSITPEMALRLEMAFEKPSADHWLKLQLAHDLWQTRQTKSKLSVEPFTEIYS